MRQRRILLVTTLKNPWSNGWYYKKGFERNGHEVMTLRQAAGPGLCSALLQTVRESRPDIVLYTKDECPVEVFRECKKYAKVVQWFPDPVIPGWLPEHVRNVHVFLTMSEGLVDTFRKLNPNSFWLTQAFEPSFFELEGIAPEDVRTFAADVAFVGNLGSKSQYLTRRSSLLKVIGEGFDLRWWGPRIPRKLSTVPVLMGKLGRAYGGRFVWGKDYAKVARLSGIFLAFDSTPQVRKSMSARMYTAVGCGAFYLCRHVEGIEEVLVPGEEIVTFRTDEEMIEKIRFYLGRKDLRERVSAAGRERVFRDHTYEVRTRQLLELVDGAV